MSVAGSSAKMLLILRTSLLPKHSVLPILLPGGIFVRNFVRNFVSGISRGKMSSADLFVVSPGRYMSEIRFGHLQGESFFG